MPIYEELKHFENLRQKFSVNIKKRPYQVLVAKGKQFKKPKLDKKLIITKKDKYDDPEKTIYKHLYDQGFKDIDIENSGISNSDMSSLSEVTDADEFTNLQKLKRSEINNRKNRRVKRKRKDYKDQNTYWPQWCR